MTGNGLRTRTNTPHQTRETRNGSLRPASACAAGLGAGRHIRPGAGRGLHRHAQQHQGLCECPGRQVEQRPDCRDALCRQQQEIPRQARFDLCRHGSPAKAGTTRVCIYVPKPGIYAIAVYHDQDGNRKFNRSGIGFPKEPFGFSNNASTLAGLPAFKSVRINVLQGRLRDVDQAQGAIRLARRSATNASILSARRSQLSACASARAASASFCRQRTARPAAHPARQPPPADRPGDTSSAFSRWRRKPAVSGACGARIGRPAAK